MFGSPGAALAGAHLLSLTLMGASRKIFGRETVEAHLVPHRGDIGAGAFFSICFGVLAHFGAIQSKWGPGGDYHLLLAALSQLGYLSSLIARGDLPPAHPHRLSLLILVWSSLLLLEGLSLGAASIQVLLEVASLWIVKARPFGSPNLGPVNAKKGSAPLSKAQKSRASTSPTLKRGSAGKGKSAPAAARKGGRKTGGRKAGKR